MASYSKVYSYNPISKDKYEPLHNSNKYSYEKVEKYNPFLKNYSSKNVNNFLPSIQYQQQSYDFPKNNKLNFSTSFAPSIHEEKNLLKHNPFDSDLFPTKEDHYKSKWRDFNQNQFYYDVNDKFGRKIGTKINSDEKNVITENSENIKNIPSDEDLYYIKMKNDEEKTGFFKDKYDFDKKTFKKTDKVVENFYKFSNNLNNNIDFFPLNSDIKTPFKFTNMNFYDNVKTPINQLKNEIVKLENKIKTEENELSKTNSLQDNYRNNSPVKNTDIDLKSSYKNFGVDPIFKKTQSINYGFDLRDQIKNKQKNKKIEKLNDSINNLKIEIKALQGQNDLNQKYLNKLSRSDDRYNVFFTKMALNMERLKKYRAWLEELQKTKKKDFAIFDDNINSIITKIRSDVDDCNYGIIKDIIHIRNEEQNANYFNDEIKKYLEQIRYEFSLKQANCSAERTFIYDMWSDKQHLIKKELEDKQNSLTKVYNKSNLQDFYSKYDNMDEQTRDRNYTLGIKKINDTGIVVDTKIHDPEIYYHVKNQNEGNYQHEMNLKNARDYTEEELRTKINKSLAFCSRYENC